MFVFWWWGLGWSFFDFREQRCECCQLAFVKLAKILRRKASGVDNSFLERWIGADLFDLQ